MDRRKHPRFIKRLEAKIIADHSSFSSISSDLSESGLFIRTNRGLNVDIPIDIELSLPGNRVSFLKGIVRRTVRTPISTMKNGMGIEIIEKDKTFIDFVKSVTGERKKNMGEEQMNPELRIISGVNCERENKDLKNSAQEKRRHKRLKVEHMSVKSEMPSATDVRIINISESGVFLKADKELDIGKKYTIKIEYKNKALFVRAAVVWSLWADNIKDVKGNFIPVYIAGMQFTDILKGEITEIISLIEMDMQEDMFHSLKKILPLNFDRAVLLP